MSKTENKETISGDTKKLLLRLKTVEAQLKQSISKKEHEEIVANLHANIERLNSELEKTKEELARISDFDEKLKGLNDNINNQTKTLSQLSKTIEALAKRINDGTVPMNVHQQALSKQREYEERISQMIPKEEYMSLQRRYEETLEKVNAMVPKTEYESLQTKISELEEKLTGMVPREDLYASEQRVRQLETKLANYVPRSDYEELAAKIVALAEEATSSPFDEVIEEVRSENVTTNENQPSEVTENVQSVESVATTPQPQVLGAKEPATQVSMPNTNELTSTDNVDGTVGQEESHKNEEEKWFRFENTDIYAKTPIEFIEDIEKVPVEVIQSHFEKGDFEKWFRDCLADELSADNLKAIKEQNISGEQLRAKILEVISSKYKQPVNQ